MVGYREKDEREEPVLKTRCFCLGQLGGWFCLLGQKHVCIQEKVMSSFEYAEFEVPLRQIYGPKFRREALPKKKMNGGIFRIKVVFPIMWVDENPPPPSNPKKIIRA